MRATRALAVTVTAFAAVGLSAPMAAATFGPRDVRVEPERVHRGGNLQISARGCGHGGRITSNAFSETRLPPSDRTSFADVRIHDRVTPGHYNLAVECDGRTQTARFEVLRGRGASGGLGGSMGPSSVEMQVGGGLVAAAAVGGAVFLVRRRRTSHAAF
ncbi:hypothetical protein EES43_27255 [Streptomyces sp. ADI96-02]|uniref:hypothetical protein n=1 Tax=unclassified Streptomyces TaxID=2593676 RepID=UPI000F554D04|nr:hypothetical protein [Streptomyces sp. ADI96-02]RPK55029.1 hypothetical protein EES43_27255 [Streptomyces sp. ADI96-02]